MIITNPSRAKSVNAVVVTCNRLSLLKECIEALLCQTYNIRRIVIVNNNSSDGTSDWLDSLNTNPLFHIINLEENIGGAGGFSLGIKTSTLLGCDYSWLMDDDTIPSPTALENLMMVTDQDNNVGFIGSHVNWTDGKPHVMNGCAIVKNQRGVDCKHIFNGIIVYEAKHASFVSLLVSSAAVYKVGLPIKEFFIWCDDIEYTQRIYRGGFHCFYVPSSIVVHKSQTNYFPSVDKAPAAMAWRFFYQARNTSYLKRKKTRFLPLLYFSIINKYRLYMRDLRKRKDGHQKEFRDSVRKGCIAGISFNPQIEYVEQLVSD